MFSAGGQLVLTLSWAKRFDLIFFLRKMFPLKMFKSDKQTHQPVNLPGVPPLLKALNYPVQYLNCSRSICYLLMVAISRSNCLCCVVVMLIPCTFFLSWNWWPQFIRLSPQFSCCCQPLILLVHWTWSALLRKFYSKNWQAFRASGARIYLSIENKKKQA